MANPLKEIFEAVNNNDKEKVIQLLKEQPDLLNKRFIGQTWLHLAASKNNVEIAKLLVEKGLDVNDADAEADVPLHSAAQKNAIDVARWLLDNGAFVDGVDLERSTPLVSAIINDHFEMVKLLRENGARLDVTFSKNKNNIKDVMTFAQMYGNQDIIRYLKGEGAAKTSSTDDSADEITGHIEKYLGPVNDLALTEIVGDLQILVVPPGKRKGITLITKGMSRKAMNVPPQSEQFKYAELMITLPPDWPLKKEDLSNPANNWPIDWLRRIAYYPFEQNTWLGGPYSVIANNEPPQPLGPNTRFTCILILAEPGNLGNLRTNDGRLIKFYSLYPLYTEERDLEKEKGMVYLLEQFQKNLISSTLDLNRKNAGI